MSVEHAAHLHSPHDDNQDSLDQVAIETSSMHEAIASIEALTAHVQQYDYFQLAQGPSQLAEYHAAEAALMENMEGHILGSSAGQLTTEDSVEEAQESAFEQVFGVPVEDPENDMPELEDGTPDWQSLYPVPPTEPTAHNASGEPLQQPLLSIAAAPASDLTSGAGMEVASTEVWDEEASFTVIGDYESEDTLPNAPDLFQPPSTQGSQANGHQSERYQYLSTFNPTIDATFAFWMTMWTEKRSDYPFISEYALRHGHDRPRADDGRPIKITPSTMTKCGSDMQGIHWDRYAVTKAQAREVRRMTYLNFTNMRHHANQSRLELGHARFKLSFPTEDTPAIPNTEHHFHFKANHTNCIPHWKHYQLRHNICATSHNAIFYHSSPSNNPHLDPVTNLLGSSNKWHVGCYDPHTQTGTSVMDTKKISGDGPRLDGISTLSADHNTLVVGSIVGVYGLRSLRTGHDAPITTGHIIPSGDQSDNSTNHVYTSLSRTSSNPLAIFSSNDHYIRTLDCATNKWLSKHKFAAAVNCCASSPDTRLRLLVSDDAVPVIADAETGEQYYKLPGHKDHGFACAWAPDGYTLATAHQDGLIQIFDARNPSTQVARIPAEQACVRSLQFSELGTGPPLLIAAEPADFVHVIDADTFAHKQTIEFFGDVAGVSLTPDGRSLWIGCADPTFGGLMEFERKGWGSQQSWEGVRRRAPKRDWQDKILGEEEAAGAEEVILARGLMTRERRTLARVGDWLEPEEPWAMGQWGGGGMQGLGEMATWC